MSPTKSAARKHAHRLQYVEDIDIVIRGADKIAQVLTGERRERFLALCGLARKFVDYRITGWEEASRVLQKLKTHNQKILEKIRDIVALERVMERL